MRLFVHLLTTMIYCDNVNLNWFQYHGFQLQFELIYRVTHGMAIGHNIMNESNECLDARMLHVKIIVIISNNFQIPSLFMAHNREYILERYNCCLIINIKM